MTKGTVLCEVGRWHEGLSLIEGGRQLAEANGLVWTEVRAHTNASSGLVVRDPRRAVEVAGGGIAAARRMGLRTAFSSLFVNFGSAARRTGDWDRAIHELDTIDRDQLEPADRAAVSAPVMMLKAARGHDVTAELAGIEADLATIPDPQAASVSAMARAFVLSVSGRHREAADVCFAAARASGVLILWALPLAGRYAVLARDPKRAREAAEELDGLGSTGPALAADIETIRAGSAALEGALPEADRALPPGDEDVARPGPRLGRGHLRDRHGDAPGPDRPRSPRRRGAAREILVRLDAAPFVARLDAALAARNEPAPDAAVTALRTRGEPVETL